MPDSDTSLARRLHRYGFLLTADMVAVNSLLDAFLSGAPANDATPHEASLARETFRQFTALLRQSLPSVRTNLRFIPAAAPVSPASFAAALWGLPFSARAILVLVCVEGFSLAEAAFIADMPLWHADHFMTTGLFALRPGTDLRD